MGVTRPVRSAFQCAFFEARCDDKGHTFTIPFAMLLHPINDMFPVLAAACFDDLAS